VHFTRENWTVTEGSSESIEEIRLNTWASMTPNDRVEALVQMLDQWKGPDARRLARTYRNVTVPPR
jgi:hypothetical protein